MIAARPNELTAVAERQRFDEVPGDVTDPADVARWHSFRAAYHRAQQLEGRAPFPLQIDFELNARCQMKCAFCTHGQQRVANTFLGFDAFARVIDEGSRHGLVSIKLNYINEPLLVRDLHRYVAYAKAHGVLNVYFATNGLLLTRERALQLIDAGLSKIMVSLDATTPATFERMRRSKRFEQIIDNIHGFLAARAERGVGYPLLRVNFLRTPVNAHEADAFIEQWTGVADMVGFQTQVALPGVEDDAVVTPDGFRCSFPFKQMVVDSNGLILPCCTFSGRLMPVGHVDAITIEDAWNSPQVRELQQLHQCGDYRKNSICRHCVGAS